MQRFRHTHAWSEQPAYAGMHAVAACVACILFLPNPTSHGQPTGYWFPSNAAACWLNHSITPLPAWHTSPSSVQYTPSVTSIALAINCTREETQSPVSQLYQHNMTGNLLSFLAGHAMQAVMQETYSASLQAMPCKLQWRKLTQFPCRAVLCKLQAI